MSVSCVTGLQIVNEVNFEDSVTNIVEYGDIFIVVQKNGQIFEYSFENNTKNLVLSIEDKVLRAGEENGLLSFALNPYANEFTISYISSDNKLVFEIFEYLNEMTEVTSSSKIVEVQSNTYSHYGGKVIWSEYYKCFLGSIGDLSEANFESRLNSSPVDSSKITGKIIGLNCDTSQFSQKANLTSNQEEVNQNIVISGLRNPWQFFEFRDNLIIFDTGFTQNEELNIAKLSETHNNFGWPVFEGPKRAEDLDSISNYEHFIDEENSSLEFKNLIQSQKFSSNELFNFIDIFAAFCVQDQCMYFDEENSLYIDGFHLSYFGAKRVYEKTNLIKLLESK